MSNEDSAAGTLYVEESRGQSRHLFISANRRLPVNLLNGASDDCHQFLQLCNAQLLKVECSRISLSGDRVRHVWNTQPHGDHKGITIVELSDEAASECQSCGAKFLRVGEAHPKEEVCLKSVSKIFLIQSPAPKLAKL